MGLFYKLLNHIFILKTFQYVCYILHTALIILHAYWIEIEIDTVG